jgi:hypothetical protein
MPAVAPSPIHPVRDHLVAAVDERVRHPGGSYGGSYGDSSAV